MRGGSGSNVRDLYRPGKSREVALPRKSFSGPELCALTATRAVELLQSKAVSPDELLAASLERLAQVEPAINATPTLCEARARRSIQGLSAIAQRFENEPGWLAGLPIGIKDLAAVEGVRTTYGSLGLADYVPSKSDPIVNLLENKGAIVAGKTNTPEMGAGGNTFNAVFGPTRNPHNTAKNAGGSSGGAAVSLATGEFWLSHGSDLAGSLRTPAAYCGVVGLRPSPGRAAGGPEAFGFSPEGVQGPMARNVTDCALFLDAMAKFDPAIPLSLPTPAQSFVEACAHPMAKAKIAWAGNLNGFAPLERDICDVLEAALGRFDRSGGTVEEACPNLSNLDRTYRVLRGFHWACGPGRAPHQVQKHFKGTLSDNVAFGRSLTVDDLCDAHIDRTTIFNHLAEMLETYDCLALPVVGQKAQNVELEYPASVDGEPCQDYLDWLRYSFLSTTTGMPSIVIPVGTIEADMPVGLQLIGPNKGEAKLLQVALAMEQVLDLELGPIDPIICH